MELQKSNRRLLRNRKGFAFLKAGLLKYHEGRSQESKRRLLSQRLGCSKTTKVDRRNRRGACFLKSWAAQRPRGPISEIEEAPAFSTLSTLFNLVSTCHMHTQLYGNYGHSVEDFW
ncbi:hypothetical protein ACFX12_012934 [Malus domestica]